MTNAGGGRGMESFPPENLKLFLFFFQFLVSGRFSTPSVLFMGDIECEGWSTRITFDKALIQTPVCRA